MSRAADELRRAGAAVAIGARAALLGHAVFAGDTDEVFRAARAARLVAAWPTAAMGFRARTLRVAELPSWADEPRVAHDGHAEAARSARKPGATGIGAAPCDAHRSSPAAAGALIHPRQTHLPGRTWRGRGALIVRAGTSQRARQLSVAEGTLLPYRAICRRIAGRLRRRRSKPGTQGPRGVGYRSVVARASAFAARASALAARARSSGRRRAGRRCSSACGCAARPGCGAAPGGSARHCRPAAPGA
jgi:hypothetical protein